MKFIPVALALALALPAYGETLALAPADPQPDAAALQPGLAVAYGYGKPMKSISNAVTILENAEPGEPLIGLSYLDTDPGEMALTSTSETRVAAAIGGYILFETPGTWQLEVISNDGIDITIGGQQVSVFDDIRACESSGVTEVEVPEAGYYAVEAVYFQRKGSSCLLMDWAPAGAEMEPVPDEAFFFAAE